MTEVSGFGTDVRALVISSVPGGSSGSYDPKSQPRPSRTHADFDRAFEYLNQKLFDGRLPPCLITLQRSRRAYGYFSPDRFVNVGNSAEVVHEIAMNPIHFARQTTAEVLSTLVHEMVHLWQHCFGKSPKSGYHNLEWARQMHSVGLIPSSTGEPGGKPVGEQVSHYIKANGRFEVACAEFLETHSPTLFQDSAYRLVAESDGAEDDDTTTSARGGNGSPAATRLERIDRTRRRKAASKTRFTCRGGHNAWAKPSAHLICGDCEEQMVAAASASEGWD